MQILHIFIANGSETNYVFPTHGTAVLFGSRGSQLVAHHFASVHRDRDIVGVFFGAEIGSIRIRGQADCEATLCIPVPPVKCDADWLTTAASETFSIGIPGANATDSATSTFARRSTTSRRTSLTTQRTWSGVGSAKGG